MGARASMCLGHQGQQPQTFEIYTPTPSEASADDMHTTPRDCLSSPCSRAHCHAKNEHVREIGARTHSFFLDEETGVLQPLASNIMAISKRARHCIAVQLSDSRQPEIVQPQPTSDEFDFDLECALASCQTTEHDEIPGQDMKTNRWQEFEKENAGMSVEGHEGGINDMVQQEKAGRDELEEKTRNNSNRKSTQGTLLSAAMESPKKFCLWSDGRPQPGDVVRLGASVQPSEFRQCPAVVTKVAETHCTVVVLDEDQRFGIGECWPSLDDVDIECSSWRLDSRVVLSGLKGPRTSHLNGFSGRIAAHPKQGHPTFLSKPSDPQRPQFTLCVRLDDQVAAGQKLVVLEPRFLTPYAAHVRKVTGDLSMLGATLASLTSLSATPRPEIEEEAVDQAHRCGGA
mmetsp:Transcript_70951/g.135299  ORF Transcript_70951/g.135299 Transcript_70951/m.135299 type:complete len:400 (-) Transcript_70951:108-1307(-)